MICSSLSNCRGGNCSHCSHANYYGEGGGYRWEFSPMFGPLFLKKDGEPLKRQPLTGKAWDAFMEWHARQEPSAAPGTTKGTGPGQGQGQDYFRSANGAAMPRGTK